ncbi:aldehyde dehydrogenase family protein [Streptomyces sp. NPDC096033]|uniref:aldehyde dehydrogenase family protein n=1 Tax=Streptomyces sp. NPDC096033 TaxID=3366071 RepID=UPI00381AADAC
MAHTLPPPVPGTHAEPARPAPRHADTLERARQTLRTRAHWSPYSEDPEDPRSYGPGAREAGEAAFRALLGREFALDQPGRDGTVGPAPETGGERSPYGGLLEVSYPHCDPDVLLPAMQAALPAWRDAGPRTRAEVCTEILHRINARSSEFAHAAVHTSGHNFLMAFHAGAVHAQDRGLEAVARALEEQTRMPASALWRKPMGDGRTLSISKTFTAVPRGISLVIGNSVFPAWNGYPALFASLATGNPVLVKPHPAAVLPLALTVRIAREVLTEAGFPADLVCLAAEHTGEGLARRLAVRPEVRLVDYAGTTAFGTWLEDNARQARVFTSVSAVNSVLVESTGDYRDMLANLAFSVSLYSGQLCTSPQNLLIPREGIGTDKGHRSFAEVVADLGGALAELQLAALEAVPVWERVLSAEVAAMAGHGKIEIPTGPMVAYRTLAGLGGAAHRFRLDDPWLDLAEDPAGTDSLSGWSTDEDADAPVQPCQRRRTNNS